jgi:hypothetical protein
MVTTAAAVVEAIAVMAVGSGILLRLAAAGNEGRQA